MDRTAFRGQEHWNLIKRRVEFLSVGHLVGLSQYYDLIGGCFRSSPQPEPEENRAKSHSNNLSTSQTPLHLGTNAQS